MGQVKIKSIDFLKLILDSITEHIVVIDEKGGILYVNRAWREFARENSSPITDSWEGVNYLDTSDKAASAGDEYALEAAKGIRSVIKLERELFSLEYPCHSPYEKRWFMMRVTPFSIDTARCFVISHQNITERKLAEEEVRQLSRIDGLTKVANRRWFDEFIQQEWNRCARLRAPISLAIIDIDHFKLLNDRYGHQTGDDCLKKIAETLGTFAKRPSDLCARYGGEEFALVYGNTSFEKSRSFINELLRKISLLEIPNEDSSVMPYVTVSIGVATMYPDRTRSEKDLIQEADTLLYEAKRKGRNQVAYSDF